ncbi:M949_RS01915 family surface polysaccharide biosynthesis protein [Terrimonas alba]|uniref:M949_RS01915 family surface polysaccharide biosynthesis protein n=1 Tax=Terrimonas alba TaxID=3349636 RepID=UPI0035F32A94
MRRVIILFVFLFFSLSHSRAQVLTSVKKIAPGQLPKTVKFKGKAHEAWKWKDKLGENILITSTVKPLMDNKEGEAVSSIEIHAFHFVKKDSVYKLLWRISDSESNCPFDLTAEFIKGSTSISDLDKDGIAETIVQYKLACRSDVSPAFMKLIMHEDTVKYALRGNMWVRSGEESKFNVKDDNVNLEMWKEYTGTEDDWDKLFGRYQSEKDFMFAPKEFLIFARQQWLSHVKERFE